MRFPLIPVLVLTLVPAGRAPGTASLDERPPDPVVREIIDDLLRQPHGAATVADLGIPQDVLARTARRILRESFHRQVHVVVRTEQDPPAPVGEPPINALASERDLALLRVVPVSPVPAAAALWPDAAEWRAPSAGFRVSGDDAALSLPDPTHPLRQFVARRLAPDGLARTLALVIADLAEQDELPADAAALDRVLSACGLPIDLLPLLRAADGSPLVSALRSVLDRADPRAEMIRCAAGATVDWGPPQPGLRPVFDDGSDPIRLVHLTLTRGTDWSGPGDGGSVDLLRDMLEALPECAFAISTHERFLPSIGLLAAQEPAFRRPIYLPAVEPVSQWTRDAGIAALLDEAERPVPALLLPRFASRQDDGSVVVPGDALAALGLDRIGIRMVPTRLLFQGGNLLVARDPADGQRLLLLGEAEIARNIALGLRRDEIIRGFAREFGVDRVVPVAGPSFHLDFDLSVRRAPGGSQAWVLDPAGGAAIVIAAALGALERAGLLMDGERRLAVQALLDRDDAALGSVLGPALYGQALPGGGFPLTLALHLAAGPGDSGVGNLQRLLAAVDVFHALHGAEPVPGSLAPVRAATLNAIRIAAQELDQLAHTLAREGFQVFRLPGISEGTRSLVPVNALHAPDAVYFPSADGLLSPLDAAAAESFRRALGDAVTRRGIRASESLRRSGGLHCSAISWPVTPEWRLAGPIGPASANLAAPDDF